MLETAVVAVFGLVALAVAFQAIHTGRATFRGTCYRRCDQPSAYRATVGLYLGLGMACLLGAAWVGVLLARRA